MSARTGSVAGLGKQRVESLTDGIFATVMTILVLSVIVPYVTSPVDFGLTPPDLLPIVSTVLSYALSFVILGVFWVGHHVVFHYIRRTDWALIWLNNVFLLFVGLLPLTSALLGHYPLAQETQILYGLNLIAVGSMLYATFAYATLHHHLVDADLDLRIVRSGQRRILMGPCVASLSILLTSLNTDVSLASFVVFPILFILPGRIDLFWQRQELA
ncbi:MAG TPA: DUF1211 domain-containing protein [Thermoplasmata archaeon]|nr:DUF1211 domain-containing protein [Thermoplasmata archaeon]